MGNLRMKWRCCLDHVAAHRLLLGVCNSRGSWNLTPPLCLFPEGSSARSGQVRHTSHWQQVKQYILRTRGHLSESPKPFICQGHFQASLHTKLNEHLLDVPQFANRHLHCCPELTQLPILRRDGDHQWYWCLLVALHFLVATSSATDANLGVCGFVYLAHVAAESANKHRHKLEVWMSLVQKNMTPKSCTLCRTGPVSWSCSWLFPLLLRKRRRQSSLQKRRRQNIVSGILRFTIFIV